MRAMWIGAGLMAFCVLCTSCGVAVVRQLGHEVPLSVVISGQFIVCFFLFLPRAWKGRKDLLPVFAPKLMGVRIAAGLISYYTFYVAVRRIPLVDAVLLRYTASLWVPAVLFGFGDRMYRHLWWGIGLGFIGVILVLNPVATGINLGEVAGVICAAGLAVSMVGTRFLTKTEPSVRILFWYFLISILVTLPFAVADLSALNSTQCLWLLVNGVLVYIALETYTFAYHFAKASVLAPISYFGVLFAGLIGWLVWQQVPTRATWLGMFFIISAGMLSVAIESRRAKRESE